MQRPPRLDVILPFGLVKFLMFRVQRPSSFEQLCRALWEMENSGCEHASMPLWYFDTCPSKHVNDAEHLQQWWWANIMGAAGSAVHQFMVSVKREHPIEAGAVKGLSFRHYKKLHRNPRHWTEVHFPWCVHGTYRGLGDESVSSF